MSIDRCRAAICIRLLLPSLTSERRYYRSLGIISILTISMISWKCSSSNSRNYHPPRIRRNGQSISYSDAYSAREKLRICEALRAGRGTSYFPRAPFDVFVAMLHAYINRCVTTSRAKFVDHSIFRIFERYYLRIALRSSVLESIGIYDVVVLIVVN